MNGFTAEELKELNEYANQIFGMDFEDLDAEDQDYVYCYSQEH